MNLKTWQAMTPEAQQDYWNKATLAQRTELDAQGLPFRYSDLQHKVLGIEFEPTQTWQLRCCSIRESLIQQLKDEEAGTIFYAQIAEKLGGELGLIGEDLAHALKNISDNEFIHYLELRGIIDVLTEQCNCERKTIEPPFK